MRVKLARAAFHELWDDTIRPARRERGAGTRRRRLGTAERDALAFVARARLRGEGKRHGQALTSMTVALLQEEWGYQGLEARASEEGADQVRLAAAGRAVTGPRTSAA